MGFPQRDMLDLALDAFAFDHVTNTHLLAYHDQYACEEILENILKGEADRDGADPQACDKAGGGKARHDDDRGDHDAEDPDRQLYQRVDQRFQARPHLRSADQFVRNPDRRTGQNPGDQQNDERDRNAGEGSDCPFPHFRKLIL